MMRWFLHWFFRNRETGEVTIAQQPNLVLWVAIRTRPNVKKTELYRKDWATISTSALWKSLKCHENNLRRSCYLP